jgi:thiamine-phosphate pyrophosphorylase
VRGLYAITPTGQHGERLVTLVRAALLGGAAIVQYRDKSDDAARRGRDARSLAALCRERGARFIVNDDAHLAQEVGADGVHLGRNDGGLDPVALAAARQLLGGRTIGVSCYNDLALARMAVAAGADYVAFGSVFPSSTKPSAVRAPLELFSQARHLGVPLVAIGGITSQNAVQVLAAGADCTAVVSDLFDAPDVAARAREYAGLFAQGSLAV